ncbi:MAG: hypothetical protein M3O20_05225 [Acidobacteriota bacterium]|nr:hypothetical protein [Acidobacteriota bacterium]
MSTRPSGTGLSPLRVTGALCAVLTILLGSAVLVGWAIRSPFLMQVLPGLAPMHRNTALNFILTGIALLGIVLGKARLTLLGSAITGTLAVGSLLEYLFHANFGFDQLFGSVFIATRTLQPTRMSSATALCFTLFAVVTILSQSGLLVKKSTFLGITGLLVAAVGASCSISILAGTRDAFSLDHLNRAALHTGIGFIMLGFGLAAAALDMTQLDLREPFWVSSVPAFSSQYLE